MFKKHFAVHLTNKVSGADRKKLRRAIEKQVAKQRSAAGGDGGDADADADALAAAVEADVELLLPSKGGELEVAKLGAPSRVVVYLHDGAPVLLDLSGKGDLVPTAVGLWRAPQLLPRVTLKHFLVSQFLLARGADVMLPGVDAAALPAFGEGDAVAVCVPGNPDPIAVGLAAMSSADASGGGRGRLVEVVQYYGDRLWAALAGGAAPNEGFQAGVVLPTDPAVLAAMGGADAAAGGGAIDEGDEEGQSSGSGSDDDDDNDDEQQQQAPSNGTAAESPSASAAAAAGVGALSLGQEEGATAAAAADDAASPPSPWPDDMDALLELALLQALSRRVTDNKRDLPVNSAALWAHMTASRPPGTTLDLKRSTHKKLGKLLQSYHKAKLLTCKEDRHSGDTIVTGVSRTHKLLQAFTPYDVGGGGGDGGAANGADAASAAGAAGAAAGAAGAAVGEGAAAGAAAAAAAAAAAGDATSQPVEPLVVEHVYKAPTKELKAIFEGAGLSADGVYSERAAGDAVEAYARRAGLLDAPGGDASQLLLDAALCDALFKGVVNPKRGELFPTHVARAELRGAFVARLTQQTAVRRGDQALVRKGPVSVNVSAQQVRGRSHVTKVSGVEAFFIDPTALAAELQRVFACSTSVHSLPGKHNPGQEIHLQGNVVDKLPDLLMRRFGVPKSAFLVKRP